MLALFVGLWCSSARANPGVVAIEIDPRAESIIEARAVRRLVQLELADVVVPPRAGETEAALFVRVLSAGEGQLRVELWERGEHFGARSVAIANGASQLVARRVGLAAAELARGLRQKRRLQALAAERARRRADLAERIARERTLDGPRALRVGATSTFGERWIAVGPSVDGELHVFFRTRLDLGVSWSYGSLEGAGALQDFALRAGPAWRVALGPAWDLDLGARAQASVLAFTKLRAVDAIPGEAQSWSARVEAVVRLEPRLSRNLRLSVGALGGTFLRHVPVELENGERLRLGGLFAGAELGVVLTPEP